jgi:hypothetical protein
MMVLGRLPMAVKHPNDVFTPRNPQVNESMYVERPDLEKALRSGVNGSLHVLIHGESGSGKSWLYKRVLTKMDAKFVVANLANASRLGSITTELQNVVDRAGGPVKEGYSEAKKAGFAFGPVGGLEHTNDFKIPQKEPLEKCLAFLRDAAGKHACCLVLDNLEAVFDSPKVMEELGNIIILLDDERYADYKVKLLIVGVPAGVREYFVRAPNRSTVANRIQEISEVSRLSAEQTRTLVDQGFITQLNYKIDASLLPTLEHHVFWVTNGVPQRVHEYCLQLAELGLEAGRTITGEMLDEADRLWLESGLAECYAAIESAMNEKETKVGRRNQTLYALALVQKDQIRVSDVDEIVRNEFPKSTSETPRIDISGMLSFLASTDHPLIKRTPKGDSYLFVDPRFKMCLRAMLRKDAERETVDKLNMSQVQLLK